MTSTLSLNEKELQEAVRSWVQERISGTAGKVTFTIAESGGNQRDSYPVVSGASVQVDLGKTPTVHRDARADFEQRSTGLNLDLSDRRA